MTIKKVILKSPLTVNATGTTAIPKSSLEYKSQEATGSLAATKVQYTVLGLSPNIGAITKGGAPVSSFTQAEINAPAIFYAADPTNKTVIDVTLRLRAVDTTDNTSETLTMIIRYSLPDVAPEGTVNELTVAEGKEVKITSGNISFTDLFDPPTAIFIRMQSWPAHGQLLKNGSPLPMGPNSEFTIQDILDGKISYKHNGDDSEVDAISFKVRDPKNKWSGTAPGETKTETDANVYVLPIKILPIDLPLTITAQGTLNVETCATGTIAPAMLDAMDEDDPALPLTWKVTKLPLHGILKKSGAPVVIGTTWTRADIAAGLITFEQDCSNTPTDTFDYEVSHTKQTVAGKFQIKLIPNLPPAVVVNVLSVPKCDSGVPGEDNIKITDPEGLTPPNLKLIVTALPIHGMMRINGSTAMIGKEFTYADILAGNLTYIHDCTAHDPLSDSFKFDIIDGGVKVPVTLPIEIVVTNDVPPYMLKNASHSVQRNGEVNWKTDVFDFTDDDTPLAQVFWELTALPTFGTLYINGNTATVGQKIARSDWSTVQWRYVANSPANDIMEDRAYFKLSDVNNVVENLSLHFVFPPPPVVCPDVVNVPLKTSFTLKKAISEFEMFATTEGVKPVDMVFTLDKMPGFGDLLLNGTKLTAPTGSWTAKDIKDMKLEYQHTLDTPPSDRLTFSVTNGFCSVSSTFSIIFLEGLKLVNNKELTVTQTDPAVPVVIDNTYLLSTSGSVVDPVNLQYRLQSVPKSGKLFLNGVELTVTATGGPPAFTQADIDAGLLTYEADPDQMLNNADLFKFAVTDSVETIEAVFVIKLILMDRPPTLTINELSVGEKVCATITSSHLNAEDRESTDAQLVFTIINPTVHGTMNKNGTPLSDGSTFTMEDILNGSISYCEETEGALIDSFDFKLVDSGGNVLPPDSGDLPLQFPIKIIPPPPPALVNREMTTDPCFKRAITPISLYISNLRNSQSKDGVVFTLRSLPTYGVLERNSVALAVGDTWTLTDIDANLVTYTSLSYYTKPDKFQFDVESDAFTKLGNTFNIKFRQYNNPPWVCANQGITVFELDTKAITLGELQLCDVDMDYDDILDPDPEDAEPIDPSQTFEVGNVLTPEDVDEAGKVSKYVGLQTPGTPMTLRFHVTSGSAKAFIRDQNSTILVQTPCMTVSDGPLVFSFTPSQSSQIIICQVAETCKSANGDPDWTFFIA